MFCEVHISARLISCIIRTNFNSDVATYDCTWNNGRKTVIRIFNVTTTLLSHVQVLERILDGRIRRIVECEM